MKTSAYIHKNNPYGRLSPPPAAAAVPQSLCRRVRTAGVSDETPGVLSLSNYCPDRGRSRQDSYEFTYSLPDRGASADEASDRLSLGDTLGELDVSLEGPS